MKIFFNKKCILLGTLLLCMFISSAQNSNRFMNLNRYSTKEFPRLYINGGLMPFNSFTNSNHISNYVKVGFNIEYHSYGLQFEYRSLDRDAKERPADFIPRSFWFSGLERPMDFINERTITVKRLFYTRSKFLQFTAQGGVSFINMMKSINFKPIVSGGGAQNTGSHYEYYQKHSSFSGLHFKAGIDFPLTPIIGVSTRAFATLTNNNFNYYGIEFDLNIGYIRRFEGFQKK